MTGSRGAGGGLPPLREKSKTALAVRERVAEPKATKASEAIGGLPPPRRVSRRSAELRGGASYRKPALPAEKSKIKGVQNEYGFESKR